MRFPKTLQVMYQRSPGQVEHDKRFLKDLLHELCDDLFKMPDDHKIVLDAAQFKAVMRLARLGDVSLEDWANKP